MPYELKHGTINKSRIEANRAHESLKNLKWENSWDAEKHIKSIRSAVFMGHTEGLKHLDEHIVNGFKPLPEGKSQSDLSFTEDSQRDLSKKIANEAINALGFISLRSNDELGKQALDILKKRLKEHPHVARKKNEDEFQDYDLYKRRKMFLDNIAKARKPESVDVLLGELNKNNPDEEYLMEHLIGLAKTNDSIGRAAYTGLEKASSSNKELAGKVILHAWAEIGDDDAVNQIIKIHHEHPERDDKELNDSITWGLRRIIKGDKPGTEKSIDSLLKILPVNKEGNKEYAETLSDAVNSRPFQTAKILLEHVESGITQEKRQRAEKHLIALAKKHKFELTKV